MSLVARITDANPTVAEMEARVARFRTLTPTDDVAAEPAYLIGMASGHDPGTLAWPEHVRAAARAVGVELG